MSTFQPKYNQPFTVAEATVLDPNTILEEIGRLQNSLSHLNNTQNLLQESIESDPDPELSKAWEENKIVMASQKERIQLLRLALEEKGIRSEHYELPTDRTTGESIPKVADSLIPGEITTSQPVESHEDGDGLHL